MPNYADIISQPITSSCETCNCYICSTARFRGHVKTQKGRGHFKGIGNKVDISKSVESPAKEPSSFKGITPKKSSDHLHLCGKCLQRIGRGIRHECNNSRDNLMKIIEKLPEKTPEQVATDLIKKKCTSEENVLNVC